MLTTLDRRLILSFVKAYIVCLVSLLGLYIVIDLFMNLDDFLRDDGLGGSLDYIVGYYGCKAAQIFDRLCEPIALLAAMFTMAWMQRNNELLPLLSAGVSTQRVVGPVLLAAFAMVCLSIVNQEMVLPNIDANIVLHPDDPEGIKASHVKGAFDSNGVHITGREAFKKEMLIKDFTAVIPQKLGEGIIHLHAKEARYISDSDDVELSGGWMLKQTTPAELENWHRIDVLNFIVPGEYFLKTTHVDFNVVTRSKNWYQNITTWELIEAISGVGDTQLASVAVVLHMRLTRPVLGMILVFMGLSVILRDQNRNLYISAGMCLVLCGVFFAAVFMCKYLGEFEHLSPALAAWMPVLAFGPLSFVMFDAVHT